MVLQNINLPRFLIDVSSIFKVPPTKTSSPKSSIFEPLHDALPPMELKLLRDFISHPSK